MSLYLKENTLNEFGIYDELKETVDKEKAANYFESIEGAKIISPKVMIKVDHLLRDFILKGGFDIEISTERDRQDTKILKHDNN